MLKAVLSYESIDWYGGYARHGRLLGTGWAVLVSPTGVLEQREGIANRRPWCRCW